MDNPPPAMVGMIYDILIIDKTRLVSDVGDDVSGSNCKSVIAVMTGMIVAKYQT